MDGAAGPAMRGEREIRSGVVHDFVDGRDKLRAARGRLQSSNQQSVVTTSLASSNGARRISADPVGHQPLARYASGTDRKSTRLNSSHLVISYAVFCLKK